MKDLIILKIGGSVCTEKAHGRFEAREKAVARIGKEISEARKEREFRMILVNGAGPFGHVNVSDYDINDGLETERDFSGFIKTICDCSYINWKVSEILRGTGLLAYPYPSSSVLVQEGKKMKLFFTDVLEAIWESNPEIIPVMNGTMMPDTVLKGSVAGGDTVIGYLSKKMKVKNIIFATDVDGIFTADPNKDKSAELIGTITKENFSDITHGISGSSNTDVTGGMLGKVRKILEYDTETIVVNGNTPGAVRDAIMQKGVNGTIIKP